ncbi:DUF3077 domain-containing protein [Pseudomonas mucidolens]|uniref:DUF3077 domain-containing protein n=1 Tax=Pseudomonas mucidolens TaxID=46679 RepID=A0A1H2NGI2_9PSED|nr:DUF3077 domain-containing protein [Pseudomonas mucidolens]SDV03926.1 Protein of unknown function [Pseudomonas mucidolens]SQH32087.1 Protein of uncharacterised function (DUF3077) [Pseudomonas mucidolens]
MINPPLNQTLGVITFSTCGKQPNHHPLFRVNSGVPIRDALEYVSELLHCSKMLALDAAMEKGADRYAWAAHYLEGMAKAVVDDLANGMLLNGVIEEVEGVGV